jgi:hypothetical protein
MLKGKTEHVRILKMKNKVEQYDKGMNVKIEEGYILNEKKEEELYSM